MLSRLRLHSTSHNPPLERMNEPTAIEFVLSKLQSDNVATSVGTCPTASGKEEEKGMRLRFLSPPPVVVFVIYRMPFFKGA